MASIIDLPDFMFMDKKKKYSKMSKVFLTFFGLFVGAIHKKTSKSFFCNILNLLFPGDGRIFYSENLYGKKIWNNEKFYFPNKRIDRIIIDHRRHFQFLFDTYCLDSINFEEQDTIIDCGANVGELAISLQVNNIFCNYIGFEPDPESFKALKKNVSPYNYLIYKLALSNKEEKMKLYLNTDGADSSLIYFGTDNSINVETKMLDSFNYDKIKLLKIEAEGAELEVLKGSIKTIKKTEYITVDYGPERGVDSVPTTAEIINFLYENNFRILKVSKHRQVGLFKNFAI